MMIWTMVYVLGNLVLVFPTGSTNLNECQGKLSTYSHLADRIYNNPENKPLLDGTKRSDIRIVCEAHDPTEKLKAITPAIASKLKF